MDGYFIDRDTLSDAVDKIVKAGIEKNLGAFAGKNEDEMLALKEEAMRKLDDKICHAVFATLNGEQLDEIEEIMNNRDDVEGVYDEFFDKNNIDLGNIINVEVLNFSKEFLGLED